MSKQLLAGFLLGLVALAPAHANDWSRCVQPADVVLGIQGCTKIIAKGRETAENLAVAHINRGSAYYNTGEYDLAVEDYAKAIELKPGNSEPFTGRGNAYYRQGEHDSAVDSYSKAIQLSPDDAGNYTGRGLAHFAKGDSKRAIADFQAAAIMFPPDNPRHKQALQLLALAERNLLKEVAQTKPPVHSSSSGSVAHNSESVRPEESVIALEGLRNSFTK
ncbi:MAG: tetratricopeptide repeat protein [Planctomycetaceae bacterium]|nr:tetratricopeptide repeat protein [Planctomycetaceae bacterium]